MQTRARGNRRSLLQRLFLQQIAKVHNLTLATLIRLNTDFQDVPENIFFSLKDCTEVRDHQCINAGFTQPVVPVHMGSDCRRYFPSTSTRFVQSVRYIDIVRGSSSRS